MSEPAPEPFFDDVVIDFSLPVDENEADVDEVQKKSAEKSSDGKEVESVRRGSQWSSRELIAAFLSFGINSCGIPQLFSSIV